MPYLLLLALLAGCDPPPPSAPATTAAPDSQAPVAAPVATGPDLAPLPNRQARAANYAFAQTWVGDLDALAQRRVIRVLTVYSLPRYYLQNSQQKGIVTEMSRRFEDFLNRKYQRKHVRVHVTITPLAPDQLIPALLDGRGDIINAGLTITPGREALVDFSISPFQAGSEILVTGPAAPAIESIDDLAGQTIHVRRSSSFRESLEQLNERFRAEGRAPVTIEYVAELLEDNDLIEMVNSGLLPWTIVDDYKLQLWDKVFTRLQAHENIVFRSGVSWAWAFRKDSPELAAAVNDFLRRNGEGTLIGNVLKKRYLTNFDWAANALAQEQYNRFQELEAIFQKYGDVYEIDYLLAAAQGFQESRLNQNARSNAGAVGVMQLLPSTAKDPNVDIADIHEVENNIHAGMKYLDFLRDRYFSEPGIDQLNRTLLALAAYNAGPARMIKLRRKAAQLGYNPNVWFDNVELVAASEIGRETVQYVANVYKYSLAYRFAIRQVTLRNAARERAGME